MRKVIATTYGPPDVLTEVGFDDPAPGPGQVLIRVSHAGVTFVETQVRAGMPPWNGDLPALPYMPGNAVEGHIIRVGPGAPPELLGRRVVSATGGADGYATHVVVPYGAVLDVPAVLPPGYAVALVGDGRTALALMRSAKIGPGETVIVTAAAGGVGSLLIQLALRAGAEEVIAVVGGDGKVETAIRLEATTVINTSEPDWRARLRDVAGSGVDVTFDGVGGSIGREAFERTAPRGRFCPFGMSSGSYSEVSVRDIVLHRVTVIGGVQLLSPADSGELSAEALAFAASGELQPVIGQKYSLAQAGKAHAAMEDRRAIGKTLLLCD